MANQDYNNYKAGDIHILEGLDAVRKRPGMYIGTTGVKGMHHILWEIIDNSIDEAANGFADTVRIELLDDNVARVSDNGRGVPVDKHPKLKISGVEVVYTQLHAGAKFDNGQYNYSGGLHGVGASVTNALSEWLTVDVKRDGNLYRAEFWSPQVGNKIKSGIVKTPLTVIGKVKGTGTSVKFKPDERVFGKEKFDYGTIAERMRDVAYLNKGVTIIIDDLRMPLEGGTGKHDTFCYKGGISDYVQYLNEGRTVLYDKPLYVEAEDDHFEVEVAIQHTEGYTENIYSYVNNIPTAEGGTHEVGFKSAITKVFNDYARKTIFSKRSKPTFWAKILEKVWWRWSPSRCKTCNSRGKRRADSATPKCVPKWKPREREACRLAFATRNKAVAEKLSQRQWARQRRERPQRGQKTSVVNKTNSTD